MSEVCYEMLRYDVMTHGPEYLGIAKIIVKVVSTINKNNLYQRRQQSFLGIVMTIFGRESKSRSKGTSLYTYFFFFQTIILLEFILVVLFSLSPRPGHSCFYKPLLTFNITGGESIHQFAVKQYCG